MVAQFSIDKIKDIIVSEYRPDKVIIFGSYGRGEARPDSDVDIMIISDREKDIPMTKRGLSLRIKLAEIPVEKDILFYSRSEVERLGKVKMSLAHRALTEGRVIYG